MDYIFQIGGNLASTFFTFEIGHYASFLQKRGISKRGDIFEI